MGGKGMARKFLDCLLKSRFCFGEMFAPAHIKEKPYFPIKNAMSNPLILRGRVTHPKSLRLAHDHVCDHRSERA